MTATDSGSIDIDDASLYAVIHDSSTLNPESKDRYTRSLKNLVDASTHAHGERGEREGRKKEVHFPGHALRSILRNGKSSMQDLLVYYSKKRKGAIPSDSTISSHCVAALALIKRLSHEQASALGGGEFLHAQWEMCNAESSRRIREKYDNWSASEQQKNNFVPWETIIAKRDEIGSNPSTYASPDHVLLSFLTMMPPMRTSDYSSLRLFDEVELPRPNTKRNAQMNDGWNYVQLRKTCGKIVINEYKTANHYRRLETNKARTHIGTDSGSGSGSGTGSGVGVEVDSGADSGVGGGRAAAIATDSMRNGVIPYKIGGAGVHIPDDIIVGPMIIPKGTYDDTAARRAGDIPSNLFRVLKTMSARSRLENPPRKNRREWVFLNAQGKPYTGRTFGMMVNRAMKRLFDGKAVTVNLVRHAASNWLDEYHRHNRPVLLYFRHWMMHSAGMQREYVLAHNMDGDEIRFFSSYPSTFDESDE